jgi:hypothetical protein
MREQGFPLATTVQFVQGILGCRIAQISETVSERELPSSAEEGRLRDQEEVA